MKKDKIIKFFKERWQHILMWVAGVLLVLFILIGKNCNAPPTLKAYQQNIQDISTYEYSIFTFDTILLGYQESSMYYGLPTSNMIYPNSPTGVYMSGYSNFEETGFNLSYLDPTAYRFGFNFSENTDFSCNFIQLVSSQMYIPSNLFDYYAEDMLDVISVSGVNSDFVDITLTYTMNIPNNVYQEQEVSRLEPDNGSFSFNIFGGIDPSNLIQENGLYITDYTLTFTFYPSTISQILYERVGMIDLPNSHLYGSTEICPVCPEIPDSVDVGSFLASSIGAFMDFELFPGFSISGLLATILAVGLFILFLKVFAGG